jgi:site-specific DNA recombinase
VSLTGKTEYTPGRAKAMTKRVAIYGRVSTDDQRDNYSIPTQVAGCLQYAEARGYTIVGNQFVNLETGRDVAVLGDGAVRAYVDDYTSRELSRPALDAALEYLETVGFDYLLVYSLDRLARDPYIRETLEREFRKREAKVVFAIGDYDETPQGEVRKDLDATFAKWENVTRVERCNRGKKKKAESGLFVAGIAPYGYAIDKKAVGGLAVVEEQAAVVRRIFHMYVDEGTSIRGIARSLTEEGVPTALGRKKWPTSSLNRILRNTIYAGSGFYNKHKKNGNRLEKRDQDKWIEYETTPLVEQWQFDEAQNRLDESREIRRRQPSRFYLLSGMAFCDRCERPYLAQTALAGRNRRKHDAQSYRHRKKEGHCRNHMISARILEAIVWEEITKVLMDPDRLRRGYEGSLAQQQETAARLRVHLETLGRRAGSLEEMRRNLTTAYLDPDIGMTKAEYLEQKGLVDEELGQLHETIQKSEQELATIPEPADLETLEAFASAVRQNITQQDRMSPEEKRQLLETLHIKVFINRQDKEIRIEGWFGPPIEGLSYQTSTRCGLRPPPLPMPA